MAGKDKIRDQQQRDRAKLEKIARGQRDEKAKNNEKKGDE